MKFTDAQKAAVAMFSSPEFLDRIKEEDDTMLKHMKLLQDINRAGLLTTNSQAGNTTRGKGYVITERAYIDGFMPEATAEKFIKEMNIHTDKVAVYVPYCEDSIHIPSSLDVPLTTTRKNGQITVHTHMSLALPQSTWNFFRKQVKLNKSEKAVYVFCYDTKWSRNASGPRGLFTEVLRTLNNI
jgi:hypothetical protein